MGEADFEREVGLDVLHAELIDEVDGPTFRRTGAEDAGDSEGGAEATTSKSRYASVALSLGLAAASAHIGDRDGGADGPSGSTGSRAAGGIGGFKLVGAVMGVLVKSRAFGYTMGGYGAGMSIYKNFLARGHEVVFPKDTAMEIGIDTRAGANVPPAPAAAAESKSAGQ